MTIFVNKNYMDQQIEISNYSEVEFVVIQYVFDQRGIPLRATKLYFPHKDYNKIVLKFIIGGWIERGIKLWYWKNSDGYQKGNIRTIKKATNICGLKSIKMMIMDCV